MGPLGSETGGAEQSSFPCVPDDLVIFSVVAVNRPKNPRGGKQKNGPDVHSIGSQFGGHVKQQRLMCVVPEDSIRSLSPCDFLWVSVYNENSGEGCSVVHTKQ